MKTKTINVRYFQRNMSAIADKVKEGQAFTVLRNAEPVFDILPSVRKEVRPRKQHTQEEYLAALRKMQFRSGEKNLSERIDEIVYR